MNVVDCEYISVCRDNTKKCMECSNNKARNYVQSYFAQANDKRDRVNEQAEFVGNAEQGGYECPVCGYVTSPYSFGEIKKCQGCGNILNIIGYK